MPSATVYVNDADLEAMGFRVEVPRGGWDSPAVSSAGVPVFGRAGQMAPASDPGSAPRTIELAGLIRGTSHADANVKVHALKALLSAGTLEIRRSDEPGLLVFGRLLTFAPVPYGAALFSADYELTVTLLCDDPYAYDVEPLPLGFGQVRTPIPLGTAPSTGLIMLSGAAVDPVISYRDVSGAVRETMGFTRTLTANDYLLIDLDRFLVTRYQSGVATNDRPAMTSGGFFALSPLDGDVGSSGWPTLEVSTGSGVYLRSRAWL